MKSLSLSHLLLYVCLILAVIFLVEPPITVAATGSADCGAGRTVTCSGVYKCVCEDGVGCTGYDMYGNPVQDRPCPADGAIALEESDN